MPNPLRNKKAEKIKKFLESIGYKLVGSNGDDEIWALPNCCYTVKLPSRNEDIPIGTMNYVVKMLRRCGVSREELINGLENI